MTLNRKRLVYFEAWLNPIAVTLLDQQDDIELVRLEYDTPEVENWDELSLAVAYQISARTELREPWFGSAALIERCPKLLAMSSIGAGYDVIDVDACTRAGILVCNQTGTNKEAVAEHTLAFMLALAKKITVANRRMQREEETDRMTFVGNDLRGKVLGIVGIGNIGTRTAQFGRMMDMEVLASDPYLTDEQVVARGAAKVNLPELLARSDFICVHCPRSQETLGMFGAAEFAQMKRTAYFLNTARGGIHKEDALVEALRGERLAGAGIDVFDVEPPPRDHPLLQLDNVVATPHTAGFTAEAWLNMSRAAAEQWIALLRGRVPPRLVNPEAWPRYSDRFESLLGFRPDPLDTLSA